ncbi:MAG: hypothetical protein KH433_06060 [Campylobacter concisus]|nr:hypothetical protein [Campylobacter concisus]
MKFCCLPSTLGRIDTLKFDEIKYLAKPLMLYTHSLNEWCFFIFSSLNLAVST